MALPIKAEPFLFLPPWNQVVSGQKAIDKRNPLRDEIAESENVSIEKSVSPSVPMPGPTVANDFWPVIGSRIWTLKFPLDETLRSIPVSTAAWAELGFAYCN